MAGIVGAVTHNSASAAVYRAGAIYGGYHYETDDRDRRDDRRFDGDRRR